MLPNAYGGTTRRCGSMNTKRYLSCMASRCAMTTRSAMAELRDCKAGDRRPSESDGRVDRTQGTTKVC